MSLTATHTHTHPHRSHRAAAALPLHREAILLDHGVATLVDPVPRSTRGFGATPFPRGIGPAEDGANGVLLGPGCLPGGSASALGVAVRALLVN